MSRQTKPVFTIESETAFAKQTGDFFRAHLN